jgi:hypothetical protein
MKTTLMALIIMVAAAGFDGKASAQTSFVVSNQQADSLGQVMVSTNSGNFYLAVPGNSTDSINIPDTAISITINNQPVPQGQQAYVTLPDQTVVAVMWETQCEVIVIDPDEIP